MESVNYPFTLEHIPASKLQHAIHTLKKIKKLRIHLMDPFRCVSANYNLVAGNGTVADLVQLTEDLARTCVEDLLKAQPSLQAMAPVLSSSTAPALADFYVELSVLLEELGLEILYLLRKVGIQDTIEECNKAAHKHVDYFLNI